MDKEKLKWEEEFDKKFNRPVDRKWVENLTNPHVYLDNTDIKSFIHTLLKTQKEEIIKMIERQKENNTFQVSGTTDWSYIQACDDIISELKRE